MTGIAIAIGVLCGAVGGWPAIVVATPLAIWAIAWNPVSVRGPVVLALLAVVLGTWRRDAPEAWPANVWAGPATAIEGHVVEPPANDARFQTITVAVRAVRTDRVEDPASGIVVVTAPLVPPVADGDLVRVWGTTRSLDDLPDGYRRWLTAEGASATMFATRLRIEQRGRTWRRPFVWAGGRLERILVRGAAGDPGVLLTGLVTGNDHALSEGRQGAFLRSGTTHITAVSGSNFALLLGFSTTAGRAFGWRRRLWWHLMTLTMLWGYAALVGFSPPSTRAALVASALVLAVRIGRKPDFLTLLLLSAAVMVVCDPAVLWRLSFQLSVAASLGLTAAIPAAGPQGVLGWLRLAVLGTAVAQLATLPILLPATGTVSLLGIPANVLIAPAVAVAFPAAAVAGTIGQVLPATGQAVAGVAGWFATWIILVVERMDVGGASLVVGVPSPPGAAMVTTFVAVVIVGASEDGRRWLARTRGSLGEQPARTMAAVTGIVIGIVGGWAAWWLSR